MQPAFGISQYASLSALHRSDVRIIIVGMRAGVKSKNEFRELGKQNRGTRKHRGARMILQVARNFFPRWGFVSLCEILLLCNAK